MYVFQVSREDGFGGMLYMSYRTMDDQGGLWLLQKGSGCYLAGK